MKNLIKNLIVAVSFVATSAYAIPTLFFDGKVNYSALTGELSVTSVLTATTEIGSMPELLGSSLSFSAFLSGTDVSNSRISIGLFDTANISITDGDTNNLLMGSFSDLKMLGRNGRSSGRVSGTVNATGGSLADMFGAGILSALEFNLSQTFSANMFGADFTGRVDGRLEGEAVAMPEPNILALLGLGLALISVLRFKSMQA